MTEEEKDELLIRIDERVEQLRENMPKVLNLRARIFRLEIIAGVGIAGAGTLGAIF